MMLIIVKVMKTIQTGQGQQHASSSDHPPEIKADTGNGSNEESQGKEFINYL